MNNQRRAASNWTVPPHISSAWHGGRRFPSACISDGTLGSSLCRLTSGIVIPRGYTACTTARGVVRPVAAPSYTVVISGGPSTLSKSRCLAPWDFRGPSWAAPIGLLLLDALARSRVRRPRPLAPLCLLQHEGMPDGRSHCMPRWLLLSLLSTPRNHLSYWVPSPRPRAALDPTTVLQGQLYPAPSDVTPRVRATKEDGYVLGSGSNS